MTFRCTILNFVMTMWCILLALRKDWKRAKKPGIINKLIKVPSDELHSTLVLRLSCVSEKMGANKKVNKNIIYIRVKLGVA